MNPFEMVVLIVAIVMIAQVLRTRAQARGQAADPRDKAENLRLRDDVKALKQRVQVLEQIVTDSGAQTAAQIEALREQAKITTGEDAQ